MPGDKKSETASEIDIVKVLQLEEERGTEALTPKVPAHESGDQIKETPSKTQRTLRVLGFVIMKLLPVGERSDNFSRFLKAPQYLSVIIAEYDLARFFMKDSQKFRVLARSISTCRMVIFCRSLIYNRPPALALALNPPWAFFRFSSCSRRTVMLTVALTPV